MSVRFIRARDGRSRPYAEGTQQLIDEEVARLLREAEQRATQLLTEHQPAFDRVVHLLLERETIDGSAVEAAVAATARQGARAQPARLGLNQTARTDRDGGIG
jgi:cell division protease FtsH